VRPPRFEPGSSAWQADETRVIDWQKIREDFKLYIGSENLNARYVSCILSYLDRFITIIQGPNDILRVFQGLTSGQKHNLNRGLRNLFNFLEKQGFDNDYLNILRKNIPKDEIGFDVNIPSEEDIIRSLQAMARGDIRYRLAYEVALDSGLRLIEACNLINNYHQIKTEPYADFAVMPLGLFRHTKVAYFGFITTYTQDLLARFSGTVDWALATNYVRKREDVVAYKYLRKFANDTMTSEALNIPESTADFIQGRTPKSIAAKHYMQLKRKAIQFYPRYEKYIKQLRRKAGLTAA